MLRRLVAAFWRAVTLKAFALWCEASPSTPVGIPFHRERGQECVAFAPRPVRERDWTTCESDGHPLCKICAHLDVRVRDAWKVGR